MTERRQSNHGGGCTAAADGLVRAAAVLATFTSARTDFDAAGAPRSDAEAVIDGAH